MNENILNYVNVSLKLTVREIIGIKFILSYVLLL